MTPEQFISEYEEDDHGYALMKDGKVVKFEIMWCWDDDRLTLCDTSDGDPLDYEQVEHVSRDKIGGPW